METNHLRIKIKDILLLQRQKTINALNFYKALLNRTPKEEAWRYYKQPDYYDITQGLVPLGTVSPVDILETAVNTIDEYVEAIDNFNENEFSAFVLGLGLNWLPLRYWGMKELHNQLDKINECIPSYEHLENSIADLHTIERQGFCQMLPDLVPPETYKPSESLRILKDLVEGMIAVIGRKS